MSKLSGAIVYRGGRTARELNFETSDVYVGVNKEASEVEIDFYISSKGGGETKVQLGLEAKSYEELLAAMVENDRYEAMRCMSELLSKAIASQSEVDRMRDEVLKKNIAQRALIKAFNAKGSDKDVARIVLSGIKGILEEMSEKKSS